jgi:two-component system, NtrC family, sensor histidine kinase KinB
MKHSIRTRFTLGMIFLFMIILVLSVFSGYYLNKLSDKTSAILKENYLSVVYARDMSDGMTNINQEIATAFLTSRNSDSLKIANEIAHIDKSLLAEKCNITEHGEDKLVSGIETDYSAYKDSVLKIFKSPVSVQRMLGLQNISATLDQKLLLLSQMNGNAIEVKTDDAKAYSKSALTKMTVLASLCFLIGMGFTFSFASYFSQRFFQLYNGIKEIVSSNFDQHLYFYEHDEFYEISLIFNEMADKLKENKQKLSVTLLDDKVRNVRSEDLDELKTMLFKIKIIEEQTAALISRIEKKIESNEP